MSVAIARDEFDRRIDDRLTAWRAEVARGLSSETLAALALVPLWTERLAGDGRFPLKSRSLESFLEDAESRGLCVRGPSEDEVAWATRRARAAMLLWRSFRPEQRQRWASKILRHVDHVPSPLERLQYSIALSPLVLSVYYEVHQVIDEWPDEEMRARLWTRLALEGGSRIAAQRAWQSVGTLPDFEERATTQLALLPLLDRPEAYITDARATVEGIGDAEARAQALIGLAALEQDTDRQDALKKEALRLVSVIPDLEDRTLALCGIAPAFDEAERLEIVEHAFRTAVEIPSPVARARSLFRIPAAPASRDRLRAIQVTVDELRSLDDQTQRDAALALLVAALVPVDLEQATALCASIEEPGARLEAFVPLTAGTPQALDPASVATEVSTLIERTGRYELCGEFLPYLTPGTSALPGFLRNIEQRLPDGRRQRDALLNVARHVPADVADPIFRDLLRSSRTLTDERELLQALAQIAPHLPETLLDEACESALELGANRAFSMPDQMRPHVVAYLSNLSEFASHKLSTLADLGKRLVKAVESRSVDVPPATARWARVAALCDTPRAAADFLMREVGRLVDAGELGAATEWYTTAERMAPVVGAQLQSAILLGRRGIEVASRSIMDARHLQRYLHREDQAAAFQQLIDGPPTHWALHYLGMGGVGKTMLLRHIMARLAVRAGKPLPVARIDFDDISPEFPVRQPGTLLLALADELRRYLPPGEDDRFTKFRDEVVEVHGALSRDASIGEPLDNIRTEEFGWVLAKFVALVSGLPGPVILILDTCEELAKLEPVGESIPAVDATFEILERVHELAERRGTTSASCLRDAAFSRELATCSLTTGTAGRRRPARCRSAAASCRNRRTTCGCTSFAASPSRTPTGISRSSPG